MQLFCVILEYMQSINWSLVEHFFNGSGNFASILGIISSILITVLIPVAVVVVNQEIDLRALDRNVILDHVLRGPRALTYLAMITIPIIVWGTSSHLAIKMLTLAVWITGICLTAGIMVRVYRWMKHDKSDARFQYLKDVSDSGDMEKSWEALWKFTGTSTDHELKFFGLFRDTIDSLMNRGNDDGITTVSTLLNDFHSFFKNRSFRFKAVMIVGFFQDIMGWHYVSWEKSTQSSGDIHKWNAHTQIVDVLQSIFVDLEKFSLSSMMSKAFFGGLKDHIDKHLSDNQKVKRNGQVYEKSIIASFFLGLVGHVESHKDYHGDWKHHFPLDWRITVGNLAKTNASGSFTWCMWGEYVGWAYPRIAASYLENKSDLVLSSITTNLFPSADVMLWARLLTLAWINHPKKEILNRLIENGANFGRDGRIRTWDVSNPEQQEIHRSELECNERNETLRLALKLLSVNFKQADIKDCLSELNGFVYPEGSREEHGKKVFIGVFEDMAKILSDG